MEQKKILWIVLAIAAFLMIIFGFAAILYYPTRSTGPALRAASEIPSPQKETAIQASSGQPGIDPDSWVRTPGATPGLDSSLVTTPNNINLTIVNGDTSGTRYGTLDVSGLTQGNRQSAQSELAGQPEIVGSAGTSLALSNGTPIVQPATSADQTQQIRTNTDGQSSGSNTLRQTEASGSAGTAQKADQPVKEKQTVVKEPQTKKTEKSPAAAQVQKKTTAKVVTEYWIQTGSFTGKLNAEKARDRLNARYLKAEIFTKEVSGSTTYRVRVGPYPTKTEADYWLGTIKEVPEFSGSYISEVKTTK